MWVDLAEVGLSLGRLDAVEQAVNFVESADLARPWQHALKTTVLAYGAIAQGDHGEAIAGLTSARAVFGELEWRAQEARADALLGRCLARSDRSAAAAAFERAIATFEACGAVVRAGWAARELSELGARRGAASRGTGGGPGELTRREKEVVDLAVEGLTAKEIGQRLFIGERTVESHLARAYAKLGVSSRVELVRKAAALGLGLATD
jgi:DNA-binding CsgD family transcriptional regulator